MPRRWYRFYLWASWYDALGAVTLFIQHRWWWTIILAIAFMQQGAYRSAKRNWIRRRDDANRALQMAMDACPNHLKIEGAFMHLDGDGFNIWVEWHDDCWVPTRRRPRDHTWTDL